MTQNAHNGWPYFVETKRYLDKVRVKIKIKIGHFGVPEMIEHHMIFKTPKMFKIKREKYMGHFGIQLVCANTI